MKGSYKKGFTLIDVLIYTGLVMMIALPALGIAWMHVEGQHKEEALTNLSYQGTFAIGAITRAIEDSDGLGAGTTFGSDPATIELLEGAAVGTTIETYSKTVQFGTISQEISKLRLVGASTTYDLTGDAVSVNSFTATDLSGAADESVQVSLTLEALNPQDLTAYAAQDTWTTTITLRR